MTLRNADPYARPPGFAPAAYEVLPPPSYPGCVKGEISIKKKEKNRILLGKKNLREKFIIFFTLKLTDTF